MLSILGVYSPKMKGANRLKFICHQGRSLVNNFSLCNNWYKSVVLLLIWLHSLVCQILNKQMSQLVAHSGNICVWVVSCNECGGWQLGRRSASINEVWSCFYEMAAYVFFVVFSSPDYLQATMARFCGVVTLAVCCLVTGSNGRYGRYARLVAGIPCVWQVYPVGGWYNRVAGIFSHNVILPLHTKRRYNVLHWLTAQHNVLYWPTVKQDDGFYTDR